MADQKNLSHNKRQKGKKMQTRNIFWQRFIISVVATVLPTFMALVTPALGYITAGLITGFGAGLIFTSRQWAYEITGYVISFGAFGMALVALMLSM